MTVSQIAKGKIYVMSEDALFEFKFTSIKKILEHQYLRLGSVNDEIVISNQNYDSEINILRDDKIFPIAQTEIEGGIISWANITYRKYSDQDIKLVTPEFKE